MKKILLVLVSMLAVCASLGAQTSYKLTNELPVASEWIKAHFAKGEVPPFSFIYDGKESASFITKWDYAQNGNVYVYTDPRTGLKVECTTEAFDDFNAVEWVLRFTNTGSSDTPKIAEIKTVNVTLKAPKSRPQLLWMNGSSCKPDDFEPHLESLRYGEPRKFAPSKGRSSDGVAPFFNLFLSRNLGAVLAIGWTGVWNARFDNNDGSVGVSAGFDRFNAYLKPGESVRVPKGSLMFWMGEDPGADCFQMAGNNKFRKFIIAHHTHRVRGQIVPGPLSVNFAGGGPVPINHYTGTTTEYLRFIAERVYEYGLNPEVMWLDAGWYEGADEWDKKHDWHFTGTWRPDEERFPDGFKSIADMVHKYGGKFMVWFEPERVAQGSELDTQHHEWMLIDNWYKLKPDRHELLNLGIPEACDWVIERISTLIRDNGIDYYRQDFNTFPLSHWLAEDGEGNGRDGITEAKYIEGLYRFWDTLLERFPDMIIDNCASGGRRIDLETTSRSVPLFQSDYNKAGIAEARQIQNYGLNLFIPFHGMGNSANNKYRNRSAMASAMVFPWPLTKRGINFDEMKALQDDYLSVRPYYSEDYYPLVPLENLTSDDIWLAYELHRPSDDSAVVVGFRRKNASDSHKVYLQGLEDSKTYVIRDADTGAETRKSGKELRSGYTLNLEKTESSVLLFIRAE